MCERRCVRAGKGYGMERLLVAEVNVARRCYELCLFFFLFFFRVESTFFLLGLCYDI